MKKTFIYLLLPLLLVLVLVGCKKKKASIEIWVGVESQAFYQQKAKDYMAHYKSKNGKDFPLNINVMAVDTGTAGGVFINDPTVAGDIITVAHDNLGRLIDGSSAIAPILNQELIDQIDNDNEPLFVDAIKGEVQGETYYFGVPYVAQSLFLYYNKSLVSAEQVETWEGLIGAATTAQKQALSLVAGDGFNNSFVLLSVFEDTKKSSLQLYQEGDINKNVATGADVLSAIKYAQKNIFGPQYGAKKPSDSGWEVELSDKHSISVIGGAWHYNAAKAALKDDFAFAPLPKFTLTEDTVYDVENNQDLVGKVMRSGTFGDVKMFVKNKISDHAEYLDDILLYFSSKEVQEESFIAAQNLPSYKNSLTEFDALNPENVETPEEQVAFDLAITQIEMLNYSIPQPFGKSPTFNFYYYSKGGPELFMSILLKENAADEPDAPFDTDEALYNAMVRMENIWKTGKPTG